tara:strand:+ start:148 stop:405 length:258 start_codon:yes stop_codon:yes gene_type:complete
MGPGATDCTGEPFVETVMVIASTMPWIAALAFPKTTMAIGKRTGVQRCCSPHGATLEGLCRPKTVQACPRWCEKRTKIETVCPIG